MPSILWTILLPLLSAAAVEFVVNSVTGMCANANGDATRNIVLHKYNWDNGGLEAECRTSAGTCSDAAAYSTMGTNTDGYCHVHGSAGYPTCTLAGFKDDVAGATGQGKAVGVDASMKLYRCYLIKTTTTTTTTTSTTTTGPTTTTSTSTTTLPPAVCGTGTINHLGKCINHCTGCPSDRGDAATGAACPSPGGSTCSKCKSGYVNGASDKSCSFFHMGDYCAEVQKTKPCIPGLSQIGAGYDVTQYDPFSYTSGFKKNVVQLTMNAAGTASLPGYQTANEVRYSALNQMTTSIASSEMETDYSYSRSASLRLGLTAKTFTGRLYKAVGFKSSYASDLRVALKSAERSIEVTAEIHKARLHYGDNEVPSSTLRSWILSKSTSDIKRFFVEEFGTHYASEVFLGGSSYFQATGSYCQTEKYTRSQMEKSVQAGVLSGLYNTIKGTVQATAQWDSTTREVMKVMKFKEKRTGGSAAELQNADFHYPTWLQSVKTENMQPVKMTLKSYASLLVDDKAIPQAKRDAVDAAIDEYLKAAAEHAETSLSKQCTSQTGAATLGTQPGASIAAVIIASVALTAVF